MYQQLGDDTDLDEMKHMPCIRHSEQMPLLHDNSSLDSDFALGETVDIYLANLCEISMLFTDMNYQIP